MKGRRRLLLVVAVPTVLILLVLWVVLSRGVLNPFVRSQQLIVPLARLDGQVSVVTLSDYRAYSPYTDTVYIVRPADAQLLVLSARDLSGNHCQITWVSSQEQFHEDCRGTIFSLGGEVLAGPGPLGMGRFPADVKGDKVIVDMAGQPDPVAGTTSGR